MQVVDIDNGNRFETYVIAGEPGSGMICVNGAAATAWSRGHKVIIMCYAQMTPEEFADPDNAPRAWCSWMTTTASPASPATRNTGVWKICMSGYLVLGRARGIPFAQTALDGIEGPKVAASLKRCAFDTICGTRSVGTPRVSSLHCHR